MSTPSKIYAVGLTGNIASGKSTALSVFASLGIQTLSADAIARSLTEKGSPAFERIKEHFGLEILDSNGLLNRKRLRQRIFSNPPERLWLEALLHPLIKEALQKQILACETAYAVVEIPLLKARKDYPYLDRILAVVAPLPIQLERIMARDQSSQEEALAILASQPSLKDREALADDLLVNDGDLEKLSKQIRNLHPSYLHFASKKRL